MKESFLTIKNSRLIRSSLLLTAGLALLGCVDNPTDVEAKYSSLRTHGVHWINEEGQKVDLRGVNVGNWLAMESWMFAVDDGGNALGSGIDSQYAFEEKLIERFGDAEKDNVLKLWRDNYLTTADWDAIAQANFNLVRIPFFYDLISDESAAEFTLKSDAFDYLDWAIEQAKQREIYVVLDMHGAPGRQSTEHHTGRKDVNEFWNNADHMAHTKWIWQQIASRYKNESAVAAYGLLNEPWGTDAATLKAHLTELYHAVRQVDKKHIIALHGHNSDDQTQIWKDPKQLGMYNVVFEVHPYPGLFGWGEQDYQTHRDWLTCGENGDAGVCEWNERFIEQETPVLMGEMQPWAGLGTLGGDIARATFDRYNNFGWAATAWSYRAHTKAGGAPNGEWGYVTNAPVNSDGETVRQLAKADSWACEDWELTFAAACSQPSRTTVLHHGTGEKTMYLVVKVGSDSDLNILLDDVQLTHDKTGTQLVSNGDFESGAADWNFGAFDTETVPDYEVVDAGAFAGSDSELALRLYSDDDARKNGFLYQAVTVEAGDSYTLSGKFKEQGSNQAWAEIYIVDVEPTDGMADITPLNFTLDINNADLADIKAFFENLSTIPLETNPWVKEKLQAKKASTIFSEVPDVAEALSISLANDVVTLDWYAPFGLVDYYSVYRSNRKTYGFEAVATTTDTRYSETVSDSHDNTYYYYVIAHKGLDQSRASNVVASGDGAITIPNRVEAEGYLAAQGVKVENASGNSSGGYIGSFDQFDWIEFIVNVPSTGTYDVTYAWATFDANATNSHFELRVNGQPAVDLPYVNNDGWNQFATAKVSLTLTAGKNVLTLSNGSSTWVNFDYLDFTIPPAPFTVPSRIEAEDFWDNSGVSVNNNIDTASNDEYVGSFDIDDWIEFDVAVDADGVYYLTYSWATQADPGDLEVLVDGVAAATLPINNSGGWNVFDTATEAVNLTAGVQTIRIRNVDVAWVNVDYIELSATAPIVEIPVVTMPALLEAEDYVASSGVSIGGPDGNSSEQYVGSFDTADWIEFKVDVPSTGTYYLNYAWATGAAAGDFELTSDGTFVANLPVTTTSGWDGFENAEQSISLAAGVQTLRITNTDIAWVNFDYFSISSQPVVTVPAVIQAENYYLNNGVELQVQAGNSVGQTVGSFDANDWIEFRLDVPADGDYSLCYTYATTSSGQLEVTVDGVAAIDLDVVSTGSWDKYREYCQAITLTSGVQSIRIKNASVGWVNFDAIDIQNLVAVTSGYALPMDVDANDGDLRMEGDRLRLDGSVAKDFDAGDWFEFDVNVTSAATYTMTVNLSAWDAGNISVLVDGIKVSDIVFGDANFDLNDHSTTFDLPVGYATIRLVFDSLSWADVANFKLN